MAYRFTVDSSEAAANGDVHLDTWVEKLDGEEWVRTVPNGHFTVVLDGAAVAAIADGEGTTAQKLATLSAMFKAEVTMRGIDTADDANIKLNELVTFPKSIAL
jgi:hypothetical protein